MNDLYNGEGPVDFTRPALVSATYANGRWRKMIVNLSATNAAGRPANPLRLVEFVYMQELVAAPGEPTAPATPITLFRYEPQDDS